MLRLPLEELVLRALVTASSWSPAPTGRASALAGGGSAAAAADVRELLAEALDPPPSKNVERAVALLTQIRAMTRRGELTELGRRLAGLPVDVRLGKMLVHAAALGCIDPVLTVAASLSTGKGPFAASFDAGAGGVAAAARRWKRADSDLMVIAEAHEAWRAAAAKGGRRAARDFAAANGLSPTNLAEIEDARAQIVRLLVGAGVLPADALPDRR
ncbi:hypothetical protein HK405_001879, partial [Cladochytrium tenue]